MESYFYDLRNKVDNKEWRARAKRDLVFQLFRKYSNTENAKMLDYGCGTGVLLQQFEKKFSLPSYGIDISYQAIKYCRKRGLARVKLFNGKRIPFKENSFNIVTAIDVLEHIQNDIYALSEIKRVLNKNGIAILLVPAHPKLWSTRDKNLHHFRRYRVGELEEKCKKVDLKILATKNVDFSLYFLFSFLHKFSSKVKGIAQMGLDTASTNFIFNELLFLYELIENKIQIFTTFPIGLSIVVIARKV